MQSELAEMCLCCMGKSGLKSLFESTRKGNNITITYFEMFQTCFSAITITESDGLPRQICYKCLIQLKATIKFKRKCEESYLELKKRISCLSCEDDNYQNKNKNAAFGTNVDIKFESISEDLQSIVETKNLTGSELNDVKSEIQDECERDDNIDNVFIYDLVAELSDVNKVSSTSFSKKKIKLKSKRKTDTRVKKKRLKTQCVEDLDLNKFLSSKTKTVCQLCKKGCHTVTKLRDHVNSVHLGIKAYYCDICEKHYTSEERHKLKHSPVKPFVKKCQHCEESFEKRTAYYAHIKEHGLNLKCECGASFRNTSSLYRHRQVHKGKKMMCHHCSKSFLRQDNLNEHIRRHNKDAMYACDVCPKKFFNAYDLKMHLARHVEDKNYRCIECDATFRTKKDLYQHTWRHHKGEKKYACKFCGKAFRRSDHRNIHQRSVHSLDEKSLQNCES